MELKETNLDDLIRKIKSEGIEEARKQGDEILEEARKGASEIIEKARKRAGTIIEDAEKEINKRENSGRRALELAARDVLLSVRESLTALLDQIIRKEYRKVITGRVLENVLLKAIEGWKGEKEIVLEVLLSEEDRSVLSEAFMARLAEEIKGGVEIRPHPEIKAGFRIGVKGEHLHYDFTDEAFADLLSAHLNPELRGILDSLMEGEGDR